MSMGMEAAPFEVEPASQEQDQEAYDQMIREKSAEINERMKNYPDKSAQLRGTGFLALDFAFATTIEFPDEESRKKHQKEAVSAIRAAEQQLLGADNKVAEIATLAS